MWMNVPSISSAIERARYPRHRGLEVSLTEEEWNVTLTFFGHRCAYCQKAWWVVEHVTPLERGGGTTKANCLPACGSCNRYKGQRTLEELIVRVQRRIPWQREARIYAAVNMDNLERALAYLKTQGRMIEDDRPRSEHDR